MRKIVRWALRFSLVLLVFVALYVVMLMFPTPLFAHARTFNGYRVYSNEPIPDDFESVIEELDRRLQAMEHDPPEASQRIYLCGAKTYAFFMFLLRKNPEALAAGLTVANESFVSVDRVRLFAEQNRGLLRHTRFEGNLAEVVAHEIAHFNSVHALGYRPHLRQPLWKSEGWAEYQANLAAIRADPGYDLRGRIDVLQDGSYWGRRHGAARYLWESQLLVEFLGEVEGYRLADLVREDVTEESTRKRMMEWYREEVSGYSRKSLPGLSTPRGSSAALISRITVTASPCSLYRNSRLPMPTPCSPVEVPPQASDRSTSRRWNAPTDSRSVSSFTSVSTRQWKFPSPT